MLQKVYSNYYQINPFYKQANLAFVNPYNKEISVPRFPKLDNKRSEPLKKKVTFNPNISVTEVESWKKYNEDVSKKTEYYKFKKALLALRAQKKLLEKKQEDECTCTIF